MEDGGEEEEEDYPTTKKSWLLAASLLSSCPSSRFSPVVRFGCLSLGVDFVCGLCVWTVCGLFVDCLWIVCGSSVDFVCGLSVDCVWLVCALRDTIPR